MIKEYITELRQNRAEKEDALNAMRAERDALIAAHAEYHEKERDLAKRIKAAQLELAPIIDELAALRKGAK